MKTNHQNSFAFIRAVASIRTCMQVFAMVSALILVGCGGGGGSRVSSNINPGQVVDVDTNVRSVASRAADATPISGSVTQSSNVDDDRVTTDQIMVTAGSEVTEGTEGTGEDDAPNIAFDLTNGGISNTGKFIQIRSDNRNIFTRRVQHLTGDDNNRRGYLEETETVVDAETEFRFQFTIFHLQGEDATNFMTPGIWLYAPREPSADNRIEMGAFADGANENYTPTKYLTTTATANYAGRAIGFYSTVDDETTGAQGEFEGEIALIAAFGVSPTIGGDVTNLTAKGANDTRVFTVDSFVLNTAIISSDRVGGFFSGTTKREGEEGGGEWGGQFYGNDAEKVGGTFGWHGGQTDTRPDITFLGAFGAYKGDFGLCPTDPCSTP